MIIRRWLIGLQSPPPLLPKHDEIVNMILEIGGMEGKISEKQYQIDHWLLDAIWKRIKTGFPEFAFEVQIGGNFYEALTKLKHAFDKWNCIPILVTTEKFEEEARQLIEGSFHEMGRKAKIINWKKIKNFHRLEKGIKGLKNEIGL